MISINLWPINPSYNFIIIYLIIELVVTEKLLLKLVKWINLSNFSLLILYLFSCSLFSPLALFKNDFKDDFKNLDLNFEFILYTTILSLFWFDPFKSWLLGFSIESSCLKKLFISFLFTLLFSLFFSSSFLSKLINFFHILISINYFLN